MDYPPVEPLPDGPPDTSYPLLRLRRTTLGHVRLEMGAMRGGNVEWRDVPIVGDEEIEAAS